MIGKAEQRVIWQGASPHGRELVGAPPIAGQKDKRKSFGLVGCVVTSIAMALRYLGIRAGAMPLDVQKKGIERNCWSLGSSSTNILRLAEANSIKCGGDFSGPRSVVDTEIIKDILKDCIENNGVALIHVDHDSKKTTGDEYGDHWILCFAIDIQNNKIFCADTATAKTEVLSLSDLYGEIKWGNSTRKYKAVRIVPLYVDC
jgi:hypothetical protein